MDIVLPLAAAVFGVVLGAYLSRRNARADSADRLLAEAVNDLVASIAEVASGQGQLAMARYASAASRIAIHGSPATVAAFRAFNEEPNTGSTIGRTRLVEAVLLARADLGHRPADEDDVRVLLFGDWLDTRFA